MPRIKTPPVASNSATMRGLKNESPGRGALLDVEVRLEHLGEWLCARYIRIPAAGNLVTAKVSGPHGETHIPRWRGIESGHPSQPQFAVHPLPRASQSTYLNHSRVVALDLHRGGLYIKKPLRCGARRHLAGG